MWSVHCSPCSSDPSVLVRVPLWRLFSGAVFRLSLLNGKKFCLCKLVLLASMVAREEEQACHFHYTSKTAKVSIADQFLLQLSNSHTHIREIPPAK